MDPILTPALVTGGASLLSSLLGGIFGSSSQDTANRTNLQISRETNEANRKQLESQQAWSEEMWQKQFDATNQYNLPKNQAQRLKDAGINPLVLGTGANGSLAGSVGMPSTSPAAMQGTRVEAYDPSGAIRSAGEGVANAVDSYFRNRNIESVTHKNEAETNKTRILTPFEMKQLEMLVKKGGIESDLAKTELIFQQAIQGQRISQAFGDTRLQQRSMALMDKEILQRDLQNKLFDVQLAYAPKLNDAQLHQYYSTVAQIKAQIGLINAQTGLTSEQRLTEAAHRLGVIVENGLKGLDFDLRKKTLDISVELLRTDLENKQIYGFKESHGLKFGPFEFKPRSDGRGYWPFQQW